MGDLQFGMTPAVLSDGSDYEKAAFGLLEISNGRRSLTSGFRIDAEGRTYANGPYVSRLPSGGMAGVELVAAALGAASAAEYAAAGMAAGA